MNPSILLIYTGGTIGMKQDPATGHLVPFDFSQISEEVPEINRFGYRIDTYSFDPVIDSSDARPEFWARIARTIESNYDSYDGFVVLHGTDTMSYSASALSYMLEGLEKSVIFTGSQLPIGVLRTDGRENLISAIEMAAARTPEGRPMVPEVCICFENKLYRGNRTTKQNSENFSAFSSPNYPALADVGIHIKYDRNAIHYPQPGEGPLKVRTEMDTNVAILKIFPGMTENYVRSVLSAEGDFRLGQRPRPALVPRSPEGVFGPRRGDPERYAVPGRLCGYGHLRQRRDTRKSRSARRPGYDHRIGIDQTLLSPGHIQRRRRGKKTRCRTAQG